MPDLYKFNEKKEAFYKPTCEVLEYKWANLLGWYFNPENYAQSLSPTLYDDYLKASQSVIRFQQINVNVSKSSAQRLWAAVKLESDYFGAHNAIVRFGDHFYACAPASRWSTSMYSLRRLVRNHCELYLKLNRIL